MALTNSVIFLVIAICFSSLLRLTSGEPVFTITGEVYCDTCRVQFITKAAVFIQGAKVRLECKNRKSGVITFSAEAESNQDGKYQMMVTGEHKEEEELCYMKPISSPDPQCNEITKDPFLRKSAQISLVQHEGIKSNNRTANSIGFMRKNALPQCIEILKQMGITASGIVP